MSKGKNNILVSIILLIFIGQAMASARVSCSMLGKNMPTEMMMQTQSSMNHDMSAMNHDMSSMEANQDSDMMGCCSDSSHCNMSSCSVLVLTTLTPIKITNISSNRVYFETTLIPSYPRTSLYRPPILA